MTSIIDKTLYLNQSVTPDLWERARKSILSDSRIWLKPIRLPNSEKTGIISSVDAGLFFEKAIHIVEQKTIVQASQFTTIEWLWYLRRLPDPVFEGKVNTSLPYDFSLAETLSSMTRKNSDISPVRGELSFPISPSLTIKILYYCFSVIFLSRLHSYFRWANKGINFRFKSRDLPTPLPTESELQAVELYDARNEDHKSRSKNLTFGRLGTVLGGEFPFRNEDVFYTVSRVSNPIFQPSFWHKQNSPSSSIDVLYRFVLAPLPLQSLVGLKASIPNDVSWMNNEVGALLLLLELITIVLSRTASPSISIPQYGYSIHFKKQFEDYADAIIYLSRNLSAQFPSINFPDTPDKLLTILATCDGSLWPLNPGPVLRQQGDTILIDYVSATAQLEFRTEFPSIQGKPANIRAEHFEHAVQSLINLTDWAPDAELLPLRGRTLKRLENDKDKAITDIDAIGCKDDVLLIVSCKAELYSAKYDMGDYKTIRNASSRLEEYVNLWQGVKQEFISCPKGQNYDFRKFRQIIAVVCTPQVVYSKIGPATDWESSGLRRAISTDELALWLRNNDAY